MIMHLDKVLIPINYSVGIIYNNIYSGHTYMYNAFIEVINYSDILYGIIIIIYLKTLIYNELYL